MNTQTKPNIASISGIKDGINQIFLLVYKHLDAYIQCPNDTTQIDLCRDYIHQLNGLLEMLELDGAALISKNTEKLTEALFQEKINSEPQLLDTLKQTINTLHRYLNELINGVPDNPMRLFPTYSNLMQAYGLKNVPESDLFFPDLIEEPPLQTPSPQNLEAEEIQSSAKRARTEYQAGLLKWLRDTSNKDGLQQMIDATSLIEKLPGSIQQRSFWWVATSFLDALLHQKSDINISTRRLCGKIEQEMRRLADSKPQTSTQLIRAILYQIAHGEFTSERARDINRVYKWPGQDTTLDGQANTPLADIETLQVTLDSMRQTLTETNHNWREFCNGKQAHLDPLLTNVEELKRLAGLTQCTPLAKLIGVMGGSIAYLRVRPKDMNENLAIEMATLLLLVENALDDFNKLPPEFSDQVETLSTRLRAITTGKQDQHSLPNIPKPDEVEYKTLENKSQTQASQEILANLRQIEGILDRFFLDTSVRSDLPTLSPLFKQISGVLTMLDLGRANTLLNQCHILVEKLLNPEYEMKQPEQTLLVDGLSSLGFFIEALSNIQPDCGNIVEAAITLFKVTAVAETPPSHFTSDTLPVLNLEEDTTQTKTDPELLSIFLEEADEVLETIHNNIQLCRNNTTDSESLTALRRGFHTLKGSGRMVDLHDLSEVAWHMEQVLNRWISERNPATRQLLDIAERIHHEFIQWCQNLRSAGTTEVHADELLLSCKELIDGTPSEISKEAETAAYSNSAESNDKITIGDTTIPYDLFEIFTKESGQHLAALENEYKNLIAQPDTMAHHPFILAAHTLASISRTIGLTFIADLGFALEHLLSQLIKDTEKSDEAGLQLIQNTIELLGKMLQKVYSHQLPEKIDLEIGETLSQTLTQRHTHTEQRTDTQSIPTIPLPNVVTPSPEVEVESIQPQTEETITDDKIDFELLPLFIEEAQELIPQIGSKLRAWRILPQDDDIHRALLRLLHTLKGGAHTARATQLGKLIHNMESNIEAVFNRQDVSEFVIDKLENEFDEICAQIEQLQNLPQPEITDLAENTTSDNVVSDTLPTLLPALTASTLTSSPDYADASPQKTILRVNADLIDHLVNESGENSIIRSKIEAQLHSFKQSLQDLTESVDRLHRQLREVEIQAETQMQSHLAQTQEEEQTFDPLEFDRFTRFQELTRLMAESVDDVMTVQQSLRVTHKTAEEAVTQQALMNRKLQQSLMQIRTLPFGDFAEHYYRMVRQVARDTGKKANLSVQGEEVEIDRSILDRINSPLEHILRNAVAHGIEEPAIRTQSNKPEVGQITINIHQENNEVIIAINDDGSGLDIPRIRDKAIQLGLIQENETLDNHQVMSLIYTHGLSTIEEVTGIAGRGVGMDVVKNEISALGGRIEVSSEIHQGTTFNIYIPLTLAIAQTLLIRVDKQTYAVPTVILEHVREFNADAMEIAYQNHQINFNGNTYPFTHLSRLLGTLDHALEIKRHNKVLLLHSGTLRLAIHVDELIGNSEVVIKNIGPQLAHAPGMEGATIMGDGEIIFILNPVKLIQRDDAKKIFTTSPELATISQKKSTATPMIMVVDDSLTVRKITGRLLEREGCEVMVAKDGLGAIELLRDVIPDVILVDLEMPRMNGFELIRHIRMNSETAKIPIIIISSRTADKHRTMADELGVNVFLGKPYKEEELLSHISKYIHAGTHDT